MTGSRRRNSQPTAPAEAVQATTLIRSATLWECHHDGSFARRGGWSARTAPLAPLAPALGRARSARAAHAGRGGLVDETMPWLTADDGVAPGVTLSVPVAAHGGATRWLLSLGLNATPDQPAGIELWAPDGARDPTLVWRGGWYSPAARPMGALSRLTRLLPGAGLPGLALELGSPAYFGQLESSDLFTRAFCARKVGLHHGLAIPVAGGAAAVAVLSGQGLPLARRVEIAFADGHDLRVVAGHCIREGDLSLGRMGPPRAAEPMARALACDAPSLATLPADGAPAATVLTWPFQYGNGRRVAMAMWL